MSDSSWAAGADSEEKQYCAWCVFDSLRSLLSDWCQPPRCQDVKEASCVEYPLSN